MLFFASGALFVELTDLFPNMIELVLTGNNTCPSVCYRRETDEDEGREEPARCFPENEPVFVEFLDGNIDFPNKLRIRFPECFRRYSSDRLSNFLPSFRVLSFTFHTISEA